MRHGEAKAMHEDPARGLNERGIDTVRRIADWAAGTGLTVDQIRHSGKRRAEQTAALVAERLEPPLGVVVMRGIEPDDEPWPVANALKSEAHSVLLVSHMPFLGRLTDTLLDGNPDGRLIHFQTAEIVSLSPRAGGWSLQWVKSPAML
jgi:phosphohistidine phosphatase